MAFFILVPDFSWDLAVFNSLNSSKHSDILEKIFHF